MSGLLRRTLTIGIALALAACGTIPARTPPVEAVSLPRTTSGMLYDVANRVGEGLESGESAFWLLDGAKFSYDVRLALIDRASRSLDVQYFIWEKDPTSRLFGERLIAAADRGVRIRILLDDLTLNGQDGEFSALQKHPNISLRTFNPWKGRSNLSRIGEYFLKIGTLNHRMHNKTIIADGHFAILGGRNIGDRYFGVWDEFVQNDLDIMAAGPAAASVADSFDLYWNSDLSFSVSDVAKPKAAAETLPPLRDFYRSVYLADADRLSAFSLEPEGWDELFEYLIESQAPGVAQLGQDLPDVRAALPDQLYAPIYDLMALAERRVLLSTAYLVPDDRMLALFEILVQRGVEVSLLTNSLASNNHMVAHTGYQRWRKELLEMGVQLFESRADSVYISEYSVPPVEPGFLGLHSKAIVVDDHLSFVGSPNIDPRSLKLNTEIGFFIDSELLAARLAALIERDIRPEAAWRVYLDERGRLRWVSSAGTVTKQPALGFMQRLTTFFINLLPLKSQA